MSAEPSPSRGAQRGDSDLIEGMKRSMHLRSSPGSDGGGSHSHSRQDLVGLARQIEMEEQTLQSLQAEARNVVALSEGRPQGATPAAVWHGH